MAGVRYCGIISRQCMDTRHDLAGELELGSLEPHSLG